MNFHHPNLFLHLLWLTPALFLITYLGVRRRQRKLSLIVSDPTLRTRLTPNVSLLKRRWRHVLFYAALPLLIVAAAGPHWGSRLVQRPRHSRDLLIALDTSRSMLAQDVSPSRLQHAKWFIRQLLEQTPGNRYGLIAFAGTAFLECPLTQDRSGFLLFLNDISTDTIPVGGTNIEAALKTAMEAFRAAEGSHRAVIVITDGEELQGDAVALLDEFRGKNIPVMIVGIGDAQIGSYIQVEGNKFVTDKDGNRVKTKLNERLLQKLASAAGGTYVHSTVVHDGVKPIVDKIQNLVPEQQEENTVSRPIERYQLPLAVGVILLLLRLCLNERKRDAVRNPASAIAPAISLARVSARIVLPIGILLQPVTARSQNTGSQNQAAGSSNVTMTPGASLDPGNPSAVGSTPNQSLTPDSIRGEKEALIHDAIKALEARLESAKEPLEVAYLNYNLGVNYQLLGQPGRAEKAYNKALDSPADASELDALAYQNLGAMKHLAAREKIAADPDAALRNLNEAQELYREAMRANPTLVDVANNQEQILYERRLAEEMQKMQQQVGDQQKEAQEKAKEAAEAQQAANGESSPDRKEQLQQEAQQKTAQAEQAAREFEQAAKDHGQEEAANWIEEAADNLKEAQEQQQKAMQASAGSTEEEEAEQKALESIQKAMQQLGVEEQEKEGEKTEAKMAKEEEEKDKENADQQQMAANMDKQDKQDGENNGQQAMDVQNLDKLQALRILEAMQDQEKDLKQELKEAQKRQYKQQDMEKNW